MSTIATNSLSPQSFAAITQLFHRISGIKLGDSKQALVHGRLQKLAQESGEPDINAYVNRLVKGQATPEELTRVVDRLTTNETYFFREPEHFNDLATRLAPRKNKGEVLIWSAASSSGEEAYSTAMLMADVLGDGPWQIIGTDLSTSVLESAQRGLYPLERAENVPANFLKRYCLKGQGPHEGKLLISKELRSRVNFKQANLMKELPHLPMFDVIFLRNVLIYFDNDAKAAIVRRVLTKLKPDGVLYTGHAESLSTLGLPIKSIATAIHVHA
jgi:chemotaxis protein methyltransferase CheR